MHNTERMMSCWNVLLLQGPKVPRKETYLPTSILPEGTDRILLDLSTFYHEHPECGLRDVALEIVSLVKQEQRVIVVDEFRSKLTRRSLISTIKRKMPNCSTLLVQMIPKHGYYQVMWAQTQAFSDKAKIISIQNEMLLKQWFDASLESIDYSNGNISQPTEDDGCAIETTVYPLQVESFSKLTFPALFCQWNEKKLLTKDGVPHPQLVRACQLWIAENACGHFCFLLSTNQNKNDSEIVKSALKHLSLKTGVPLFAVKVADRGKTGTFLDPPQPGMMAFLQAQYSLDLHHRNTRLLYDSVELKKVAESAGIPYFELSRVLASPAEIIKGIPTRPQAPDMLKGMQVVLREDSPSPSASLLSDLRHNSEGFTSKVHPSGVEEVVIFSDMQVLSRFREECVSSKNLDKEQDAALEINTSAKIASNNKTRLRAEGVATMKRSGKSTSKPLWMAKRPRQASHELHDPLSLNKSTSGDIPCAMTSKTMYLLSQKELVSMANQVMKHAGYNISKAAPD